MSENNPKYKTQYNVRLSVTDRVLNLIKLYELRLKSVNIEIEAFEKKGSKVKIFEYLIYKKIYISILSELHTLID